MDFQTIIVELKVPVSLNLYDMEGVVVTDIEENLKRSLNDFEDGRLPFGVELIQHGLEECIKQAVQRAVENIQLDLYGRTIVGNQSKWSKLSTEILKKLQLYARGLWFVKVNHE